MIFFIFENLTRELPPNPTPTSISVCSNINCLLLLLCPLRALLQTLILKDELPVEGRHNSTCEDDDDSTVEDVDLLNNWKIGKSELSFIRGL